ncbi:MAG: T9SS type A sorting domain-containing protein [Saprospiraceae bacterium]
MKNNYIFTAIVVALLSTFLFNAAPPPIKPPTVSITPASSAFANDGAIDLTTVDGYPPFSFEWVGPNGFISSSEDISGLRAGAYIVQVYDRYCGVVYKEAYVKIGGIALPSAIEETHTDPSSSRESAKANVITSSTDENFSVKVYPNPFGNQFNVEIQSSFSRDITLDVYNVIGKRVKTLRITVVAGTNVIQISNMINQSPGVYYLKVSDGNHVTSVPIIKE